MTVKFDYTLLRQQLLAKRKAMSTEKRQTDSLILCKTLLNFIHSLLPNPSTIAAFWPIREEIDIRPLLEQLDGLGYQIVLPKIIEKNAPLHFFYWTPQSAMVLGTFNIPEPEAIEECLTMPDLILTPLLGFTEKRDRLGYGKGYYDRTLATWINQGLSPYAIGLSWDEGYIEDEYYQAATHDVPLQKILTPSRWI